VFNAILDSLDGHLARKFDQCKLLLNISELQLDILLCL
jgi:hypothetical protein